MFGQTRKQWHILTLFGHPIYLDMFFLILIGIFAFMGVRAGSGLDVLIKGLLWAPTLFLGILIHELGHALTIQGFGYGTSKIVLHGFGGVTINQRRQSASAGQSILISFAGPAASALLGMASLGVFVLYQGVKSFTSFGTLVQGNDLLGQFFGLMAVINIVWAIFNLLPINPMDGGHIVLHTLRAVLEDNKKAAYYSATTSLVVLGGAILFFGLIGALNLFLILILGLFAYQNYQILQATKQGRPPRM